MTASADDAKAALDAIRKTWTGGRDWNPEKDHPPLRTASGKEAVKIEVTLKVVTPILGGSPKLRQVDKEDIIRVPSVRGHLRFWWRALYGHEYATPKELYEAESALWGRAADENGGRSEVEVRVDDVRNKGNDTSDIVISDSKIKGLKATLGAYALWPAQKQDEDASSGKKAESPAERYKPGLTFTLKIFGPRQILLNGRQYDGEAMLRNIVRAWILFGGYGSRTRRGLGSLMPVGSTQLLSEWLPEFDMEQIEHNPKAIGAELRKKFVEVEAFAARKNKTLPTLAGAVLLVPLPDFEYEHDIGMKDAQMAWNHSLGWLRQFRQGAGTEGARKRESGDPGVSNWPEADKIRHITGYRGHQPQHDDLPAFPRAEFGLPIGGKFKKGQGDPPGHFEIRWAIGAEEHDRLASGLILKAMPMANGKFLPIALWLGREDPSGSKVYLKGMRNAAGRNNREAVLGQKLTGNDKNEFTGAAREAMRGSETVRDAFLAFIKIKGASEVAP